MRRGRMRSRIGAVIESCRLSAVGRRLRRFGTECWNPPKWLQIKHLDYQKQRQSARQVTADSRLMNDVVRLDRGNRRASGARALDRWTRGRSTWTNHPDVRGTGPGTVVQAVRPPRPRVLARAPLALRSPMVRKTRSRSRSYRSAPRAPTARMLRAPDSTDTPCP